LLDLNRAARRAQESSGHSRRKKDSVTVKSERASQLEAGFFVCLLENSGGCNSNKRANGKLQARGASAHKRHGGDATNAGFGHSFAKARSATLPASLV